MYRFLEFTPRTLCMARESINGKVIEDWHEVDEDYYNNYVESAPWFNQWPGGSCRTYKGYTYLGYVVTKVCTVKPDFDGTGHRDRYKMEFRITRRED